MAAARFSAGFKPAPDGANLRREDREALNRKDVRDLFFVSRMLALALHHNRESVVYVYLLASEMGERFVSRSVCVADSKFLLQYLVDIAKGVLIPQVFQVVVLICHLVEDLPDKLRFRQGL